MHAGELPVESHAQLQQGRWMLRAELHRTGVGFECAGQNAQQRALACAVGADDGHSFAAFDLAGRAVEARRPLTRPGAGGEAAIVVPTPLSQRTAESARIPPRLSVRGRSQVVDQLPLEALEGHHSNEEEECGVGQRPDQVARLKLPTQQSGPVRQENVDTSGSGSTRTRPNSALPLR